jgi:glycosyltransferase involved in cell wall biosynthesis
VGRVLIVANDFPYPPHHGAAVDMWNRILSLKQIGFDLELIATVRRDPKQEHIDAVEAVVERLSIIKRDRGVASVLSLVPFQVRSRMALKAIPLVGTYDAILLESEYVASILENVQLNAKVRILRLATDEPRHYRELSGSARTWIERCFYLVEALKFDGFSPQFKSKCDLLWFISDLERTHHLQRHPDDSHKAVFLPPDPGVKTMRPYSAAGSEVLFIGSLTFPPNLEGLEWYVEHIHPSLSSVRGYSLTVAGRTDEASLPRLRRALQRYSNISLCSDPEELDDLYNRSAVFVNPVLRGAGVKLKTIHALRAGVPVVSTSIGMEGTGLIDGTHLFVADSVGDFVRSVEELLQDRVLAGRLVHSAQTFLAATYDNERNIRHSLSSVLSVPACAAG